MYSKHFVSYLLISQLFSWEFQNFVCTELTQRTENMCVCACVSLRGDVCVYVETCVCKTMSVRMCVFRIKSFTPGPRN